MKLKNLMVVLAASFMLSGSIAQAAPSISSRGAKNANAMARNERPMVTTQAAPSTLSSKRWGLGLTTFTISPAISAWLELDPMNSVQAYLAVPTTSPFNFSVGGNFRHTMAGTRNAGLHAGGAVELGAVGDGAGGSFYVNLGPTAGIHYAMPSLPEVMFSFDAGAMLTVGDVGTSFQVGGMSGLVGFSIHYFL